MNRVEQAVQSIISEMKSADLDVLIATTQENISYACGYLSLGRKVIPLMPMFLVCNRQGETRLVASRADLPSAVESGLKPEQLVLYGNFQFSFIDQAYQPDWQTVVTGSVITAYEALEICIKELGAGAKRIGLDEEGVNHQTWSRVTSKLEGAEAVFASQVFKRARLIKSKEEVARLRYAGELVQEAIILACTSYKPGDSEESMRHVIDSHVIAKGGMPNFTVVSAGLRSAYVDTRTTDRVIQPEDIIRFDVGCTYEGYQSDIARTAIIGRAGQKLNQYYDAIYQGMMEMVDVAKPGVSADTLFNIGVNTTRAAGLPHYKRGHCGHGIGKEVYEMPPIIAGEQSVMRPGMTLCFETPYYELGWGGIQVEDTVLITNDGCEMLTKSPAKVIEI